jgi:hypothetical protein
MALGDQNQPLWFLAAKTPALLHLLMKANNLKFNKQFHYLPPVFARGQWYTWFEIKQSDLAKDELNTGEAE